MSNFFHIPSDIQWNPHSIAHQLSERGLHACRKNSRVVIAVNLQQDDEWQSKILRPTKIDLQRSGAPQVTITFLPERSEGRIVGTRMNKNHQTKLRILTSFSR